MCAPKHSETDRGNQMSNAAGRRKQWLTGAQVAARYNRHRTTIARWREDELLGFPKSTKIRGRNYFAEDELDLWDQARGGRDPVADLALSEKLRKGKETAAARRLNPQHKDRPADPTG